MTQVEKDAAYKRIYELWEQGMTDPQIALELGLKKSFVWYARCVLDLESNYFGESASSSNGERMRLYQQGLSDIEIARAEGVNPGSVWYWRKAHDLPSNSFYVRDTVEAPDPTRYELWKKGLTDREIEEIVGLGPGGIGNWRRKHGLKPNKKRAVNDEI